MSIACKICFVVFLVGIPLLSYAQPGGIGGTLELWLKADAGTNCSTNNCAITSWTDQSGSGNNASGTGSTVYNSSFTNNNPSLSFTDDAQPISGAITRPNGTGSTIFVIGNVPVIDDKCFFEIGTGGNRQFFIDRRYASNNNYSFQTNVTSIWEVSDPGGTTNSVVYENGGNIGSFGKDPNTNWTTGGAYYIGDDRTLNNRLSGNLAEIIYYDQQLPATNRQRVESYLAIKYGISMTDDNDGDGMSFEAPNANGINEGDYVSSAGTQVWNAASNSTYHHNVTAIGRDDLSGLDQQKSLNQSSNSRVEFDHGGTFGTDDDFIVWGHDNSTTNSTATGTHPSYTYRMARIWKVQISGTPGNVDVNFRYSNNGLPGDYALLLHPSTPDFSSGATAHTTGATINGDIISFTNVPLTDGMYFTIGTNLALINPAPGGISDDLSLWLMADKNTNCMTDACAITTWSDQSENSNDAAGTGDATFSEVSANYNPGIDFTDDGQPISGSITRAKGNGSSIFIVGEIPAINDKCFIELGTAASRQFFIDQRYAGNNNYTYQVGNTSIYGISDPGATTNADIFENGFFLDNLGKNTTSWTTGGSYYIGDDRSGGNELIGSITEVIFYDDQLAAASQQKIESYLAVKYGVSITNDNDGDTNAFEEPNQDGIDEGDLVDSNGTVIWDATLNTGYHNNIIGIGRDDFSDLVQKQSQTMTSVATLYIDNLAVSNATNAGTIANNNSFLVMGSNNASMCATDAGNSEKPMTMYSRIDREWKVTNTNFDNTFGLAWVLSSCADLLNITESDLRLLIDTDGDFTNASIYAAADGLTFTNTSGQISIGGITTTMIPLNSTRYLTLASASEDTPLPVSLISFELAKTINGINIMWETANELNNDYFELEKSLLGDQWLPIGQIKGQGTTNTISRYRFNDLSPIVGTSYYRLRQVDFSGIETVLGIKSINSAELGQNLTVYPNPSKGKFTLQISKTELNQLKIYNMSGQEVMSSFDQRSEISKNIELDLSNLPAGMYTLKTTHQQKKIVIQR